MTVPAQPIRIPAVEVAPPAVQPYQFGLLSAATVTGSDQQRWEGSGIVFPNDGCDPGGGIWLNPCEHPPPPDEVTAFTVTVTQPTAGEYTAQVTLTARDATYTDTPVAVTVGGHRVELATVAEAKKVVLGSAGRYPVTADIAATGPGPECGQAGEVVLVGLGETPQPVPLTCAVTPGWPVKRIPMGQDFTEGRAFTVYEAIGCLPVGFENAADRANRRLMRHEQYWVEHQFARTELHGDHVDVLNAGAALRVESAISQLEQALAARYGGLGVLHAPREIYGLIPGRFFVANGARWRTQLNNTWAFGAGYTNTGPHGEAAAANQGWLWATGPVMGLRSEVQIRESFTPARNERMALAERSYVLTAECLHLAVLAEFPGAA